MMISDGDDDKFRGGGRDIFGGESCKKINRSCKTINRSHAHRTHRQRKHPDTGTNRSLNARAPVIRALFGCFCE